MTTATRTDAQRLILRERAAGATFREVVEALATAGIPSPTGRPRWPLASVQRVLGADDPSLFHIVMPVIEPPAVDQVVDTGQPITLGTSLLGLLGDDLPGAACSGRYPLFDHQVHSETKTERRDRYTAAANLCHGCVRLDECATRTSTTPLDQLTGIWAGALYDGEGPTMNRRPRPAPVLPVPKAVLDARARTQEQAPADAQPWYRIVNEVDRAEVWIYDEIGWYGVTAQDFVRDLVALRSLPLDVHLNSPGGDVFDGVAIYNALRNHPRDVVVHIDGLAASAASFIAMAGDRIVIEQGATMMIHDAQGVCMGPPAEMLEMAELLEKASDIIADIYAQRTGGTRESWRTPMKATTWYTADEAIAAGLADELSSSARVAARAETPLHIDRHQFAAAIARGIEETNVKVDIATLRASLEGGLAAPVPAPQRLSRRQAAERVSEMTAALRDGLGLAD